MWRVTAHCSRWIRTAVRRRRAQGGPIAIGSASHLRNNPHGGEHQRWTFRHNRGSEPIGSHVADALLAQRAR